MRTVAYYCVETLMHGPADTMDATNIVDESRESQDIVITLFGKSVLWSSGLDLGILNGCPQGKSDTYAGKYTCQLVVDCFIVSKKLKIISRSAVIKEISKHMATASYFKSYIEGYILSHAILCNFQWNWCRHRN